MILQQFQRQIFCMFNKNDQTHIYHVLIALNDINMVKTRVYTLDLHIY